MVGNTVIGQSLSDAARKIQVAYRRHLQDRHLQSQESKKKDAVGVIENTYRRYKNSQEEKKQAAAVKIQKVFRGTYY